MIATPLPHPLALVSPRSRAVHRARCAMRHAPCARSLSTSTPSPWDKSRATALATSSRDACAGSPPCPPCPPSPSPLPPPLTHTTSAILPHRSFYFFLPLSSLPSPPSSPPPSPSSPSPMPLSQRGGQNWLAHLRAVQMLVGGRARAARHGCGAEGGSNAPRLQGRGLPWAQGTGG